MNEKKIPRHVAIILDGNGRWAKKRLMPRNYGHAKGSANVEVMCHAAWDLGIKYFTVYAFSTENWKRPEKEVTRLMELLRDYLKDCIKKCGPNNMRVRILGERTGLSQEICDLIDELEEVSKNYDGLQFNICLNYGGRDEIVRAVRKLYEDVESGKLSKEDIDEKYISEYLDTRDIPDPDLLIRTSGEQRISNFMLWQMAYTEFYFTEVLWPDFDKAELARILDIYAKRDRRFGGI
ncbi:MAG: isoprenyl transferase [Lachnospiraceae bacterium]|nr:isoprenyl transferase [Lachnospiraceae bacterium]